MVELFHEGRRRLQDFSDGGEDKVTEQPTNMNMNDKTYRAIMINSQKHPLLFI